MAADPRPHSAKNADGSENMELEARFRELFSAVRPPTSKRPTDDATSLTFLQELWDRMAGKA